MKTVFICSPFKGNEEENTKKAKFYASVVIATGAVPIVPHLYFPHRMQNVNGGLLITNLPNV